MSKDQGYCPYAGLQPYSEEDREYFFGRKEDTETIAANAVTASLTILYGASGCGKTSVLQAGVVPFLRGLPDVLVVLHREWQDRTFLATLKERIALAVGERTGRPVSAADLPLDELLVRAANETRTTLTIILDQFEEYFLYHPESEAENRFDVEFARAVNRDDVDANFLLSMREDSLALLDRFQKRIPSLFDNYLRIERLSREAARDAIVEPLGKYNDVYGTHIKIEPALVDQVLDRVKPGRVVLGEGGQGVLATGVSAGSAVEERVETPYLQLVMERLWDEEVKAKSSVLRLATLQRLGGAESIAETHLDNTLSTLPGNEQDMVGSVFRHLVTPGGAKIALGLDDLAGYAKVDRAQLKPVLDKLTEQTRRILRRVAPQSDPPSESRYEIFHDVLAPAILRWCRGREQREAARQATLDAEKQAREVARQRRYVIRLAILLLTVVALLLFSVVACFRALDAEEKAVSAQKEAVSAQKEAVSAQYEAVSAQNEALSAQTEALTARQNAIIGATEQLVDAGRRLASNEDLDGAWAIRTSAESLDAELEPDQRLDKRNPLTKAYFYHEICGLASDQVKLEKVEDICQRAVDLAVETEDAYLNFSLCRRRSDAQLAETVEPACERANELIKPLAFGETVTGTIGVGSGDVWSFENSSALVVTIDMNQLRSNLEAYLVVFGPAVDMQITDSASGDDPNARISDYLVYETGVYTITASGLGASTGDYTLSLTLNEYAEAKLADLLTAKGYELAWEGETEKAQAAWQKAIDVDPSQPFSPTVAVDAVQAAAEMRRSLDELDWEGVMFSWGKLEENGSHLEQFLPLKMARLYHEVCGLASDQDNLTAEVMDICQRAVTLAANTDDAYFNFRLCGLRSVAQLAEIVEPACGRANELAKPLAFGETVTGTVEGGSNDLWTFENDTVQAVTVAMNQEAGELDPFLTLVGLTGDTLADDDDNGGNVNARIGDFVLYEPGIYSVVTLGRGDTAGAYTLSLNRAAHSTQELAGLLVEQGRELVSQGNAEEALAAFRQAKKLDPSLPMAPEAEAAGPLVAQGRELASQGSADEALAVLEKALALTPSLDTELVREAKETIATILVEQATDQVRNGAAANAVVTLEKAQTIAREIKSGALYFAICNLQMFSELADVAAISCKDLVAQAPTIEPNSPVTGTIRSTLSDPWKLEIASNSRVTITLSAANDGDLVPYLMLFDEGFQLIAEHDDIEKGVIQDSALYDVALTHPGVYWIAARRCCPGNDQGSTGAYVLEVTLKEEE